MTIIAAYKQGNAVSIVSDFRASFPNGNRSDSILKYFQVDDRMGFFMAGSVPVWSEAAQIIHSVANDITVDNVVSTDGPLYIALRTLMETTPAPWNSPVPKIMGIGVYWTPTQTVYFELQGKVGSGIMLLPLEDGMTVLGSGQVIPGITDLLTRAVQKTSNGIRATTLQMQLKPCELLSNPL